MQALFGLVLQCGEEDKHSYVTEVFSKVVTKCFLFFVFTERDSNQPAAETSEDETEEKPKFIVNEPEAKEQLTREIIEHDQKERSHHHQKKVLPLHKPQHHHRHNKHGKHGSRERGHDEN